jgi:hypothetical protein
MDRGAVVHCRANPRRSEFSLQTFQCDPGALTPTPGAPLHTPFGDPPESTPNLLKRCGIPA